MCMDCGCGIAHGDPEHSRTHLVVEKLKEMAEADKTSMSAVLTNINEAAELDRKAHPQEWA
jgi:phosphoribosyl 1,2-cyclic phosphodiesterase